MGMRDVDWGLYVGAEGGGEDGGFDDRGMKRGRDCDLDMILVVEGRVSKSIQRLWKSSE